METNELVKIHVVCLNYWHSRSAGRIFINGMKHSEQMVLLGVYRNGLTIIIAGKLAEYLSMERPIIA